MSVSLSFCLQALAAAQNAIRRFEKAGTPWQRPPDYYAEMVKSDDHMAKVKQQLMHETQQMEAVEQRYPSSGTHHKMLLLQTVAVITIIQGMPVTGGLVWS